METHFLFPLGPRPVSLQPNPHPKSSLLPAVPVAMSLGPVGFFPHLPVCVLLMLPGPGQGVQGGRRCLISGRDWTCGLERSDPQLCLSGNPAQPLAEAHPERGKVSQNLAGEHYKAVLKEHM